MPGSPPEQIEVAPAETAVRPLLVQHHVQALEHRLPPGVRRPEGAQLERIWDQAARCAWLRRQASFDSGPYEQAARVFRQHGYTREAEQILMAQRKHARQVGRSGAAWPRRVIDAAHAIVGYGYRPSRVLWLLAALLVLVAASLELPASQATLGWLLSSIFVLSLARLSRSP
jgi:hypothetical protein